jgi:ribose-phosphate pyrophosphokinase
MKSNVLKFKKYLYSGISLISSYFIFNSFKKQTKLNLSTIEEIDNEYYNEDLTNFTKQYYNSPLKDSSEIVILHGNNSISLANDIASNLKANIGRLKIEKSSKTSESKINLFENISGKNVILINSIAPPVNDNIMETVFLVSNLKRSNAKNIILVIPYFGYSKKSDSDEESNFPLCASIIVKLFEKMGVNQIITMNLSSKHITGYSQNIPIIDLDMSALGVGYYKEKLNSNKMSKDIVIISPHVKSISKAKKFQELMNNNGFNSG